jgi:hypothetical protein
MRLGTVYCSWLILCAKRRFTLEGLLGREGEGGTT